MAECHGYTKEGIGAVGVRIVNYCEHGNDIIDPCMGCIENGSTAAQAIRQPDARMEPLDGTYPPDPLDPDALLDALADDVDRSFAASMKAAMKAMAAAQYQVANNASVAYRQAGKSIADAVFPRVTYDYLLEKDGTVWKPRPFLGPAVERTMKGMSAGQQITDEIAGFTPPVFDQPSRILPDYLTWKRGA